MGIIAENRAKVKPGDVFGRWTVLGRPFFTERHHFLSQVVCRCSCGTIAVVFQNALLHDRSMSCGCFNRDCRTTHGMTRDGCRSRLYRCWEGMLSRCYCKTDPGYRLWGARGITVCDEWMEADAFSAWATANGYADHLTIDRINNDGNYEPGNCRWATARQQGRNRRTNKLVTAFGETKLLCEWAEDSRCKVKRIALKMRLRAGWSPERAIAQEPKKT